MGSLSADVRQAMDHVISGTTDSQEKLSKSEKMRRLADAGYEKADIARYLGVRYQFVYNVLSSPRSAGFPREQANKSSEPRTDTPPDPANTETDREGLPKWYWTKIGKAGRLELPEVFLEALGVVEGDDVQLALDRSGLRVVNRDAALRELQAHVRRFVPEGVSLVDELIAERRSEAAREAGTNCDE